MKSKKVLSMVTVLAMCTSMLVMPQANAEGETVYTSANGWTLNGSEEQANGSLAIKAGGNTPTVFSPALESGKKYSITYDVTGLTTDSSNTWAYPFRVKVSAGGEDVDGALAYRMGGTWESGANSKTGTNGTNEIIYDTLTGAWETYALGKLAKSGTFTDRSEFAIKFYRWSDLCQAYISNVTVTDITPATYNSANGWSLAAGAAETANGELTMVKDAYSWFTPTLESGKTYEISYYFDYQGAGESGSWSKPFQMTLADADEEISDPITYYRTTDGLWATANGKWSYGVNSGKQGTVKVYIDTATGEWRTNIFGSDGPVSGSSYGNGAATLTKFNSVSGFRIGFRCQRDCDPGTYPTYISNVTVTDITPGTYNSANGWSLGAGAEEQQDGSLKLAKTNYSWFAPALEKGKAYEISYDVDVTVGGDSIWAKPFQMIVADTDETFADILNCYCTTGVWADGSRVGYGATGTSGTNKVYINTVTYEWSVDILGTGNGPSGTFADLSGFKLGFRCEPYVDPASFPSYISNVVVTEIYRATVSDDGNGSAQVSQTDNSATFTATADTGYDFDGWYNGQTKVSSANPYVTTLAADTALTAKFTAKAAAVTATTAVSGMNDDGKTYKVGLQFENALDPSDYTYILFKAGDAVKGGTVEDVLGSISGDALIAIILNNSPSKDVAVKFTNEAVSFVD